MENKTKYALYSKGNGYYTGKCYQCKGAADDVDRYPIFTDDINKAKQYSSIKRVQNFIKSFALQNPFCYEWSIEEVTNG